ncbi:MAG: patatin-like phospholipase family protein [Pseudomonadota bacterium]
MAGLRLPAHAPISDWKAITHPDRMAGDPVILALSGGADDGAFGAGLLAGWTKRGDRPEFDIVTGVSAGALIAPFAFLGATYDDALADTFARLDADTIAAPRGVLGLLDSSLFDTSPLRALIGEIVDAPTIEAVAAEHRDGRRLFIVTTDLDRETAIVWNMGAIAATDDPRKISLFQDVLLASSSIPGLFPPVEIGAVVSGRAFTELHIDGGASTEFLAVPEVFLRDAVWPHGSAEDARLFVVVNNRLSSRAEVVPARLSSIVERSLSTLIRSYERQSAERVLAFGRRTGVDTRIAAIEPAFQAPRDDWFDPAYMRAVYEHGVEVSLSRRAWHSLLEPLLRDTEPSIVDRSTR